MSENSGFAAYAMFNALMLHFQSDSYDYVKYNGKTRVTKQNFLTRKDKYSFYKLSRKYSLPDLKNYYVANFLEKEIQWIGEITGPEGEENYRKWQKRIQSLSYIFRNEISKIYENGPLKNSLRVNNKEIPILLSDWMQKKVCIETVLILDNLMPFLQVWYDEIAEDIIWPKYQLKLKKYKSFLNYDTQNFKTILEEVTKEYAET